MEFIITDIYHLLEYHPKKAKQPKILTRKKVVSKLKQIALTTDDETELISTIKLIVEFDLSLALRILTRIADGESSKRVQACKLLLKYLPSDEKKESEEALEQQEILNSPLLTKIVEK